MIFHLKSSSSNVDKDATSRLLVLTLIFIIIETLKLHFRHLSLMGERMTRRTDEGTDGRCTEKLN